jgi:hypothetical protein
MPTRPGFADGLKPYLVLDLKANPTCIFSAPPDLLLLSFFFLAVGLLLPYAAALMGRCLAATATQRGRRWSRNQAARKGRQSR